MSDRDGFYLKAQLSCGAIIEFEQPQPYQNITITLTPKAGIGISDAADIKDGKLVIRSTAESLVGVLQILLLMTGEQKRKKFLGLF